MFIFLLSCLWFVSFLIIIFFDKVKMYLYVFDGVVLKDGLFVGIIMVIFFLFLVLDMFVEFIVVMMGELMFIGKVLCIGGLWEKIVVVRCVGCEIIIFFKDNMFDWLEFFKVCLCCNILKV